MSRLWVVAVYVHILFSLEKVCFSFSIIFLHFSRHCLIAIMYVPSSNSKCTCKKCKHKIHVDDIEAIFKEQLTEFIISGEEVNRYLDGTHTVIREKGQEI